MKKLEKQNGITLIALIITIIVMLILVGVTVSVALNGGLFDTSKTATTQTQLELEKEALLSSVVGAIKTDGTVDFTKLDADLPTNEWRGSNGTYTSPKGNIFIVDENGRIEKGSIKYTPYSIGDEVTVKGESFFVIEESDETEDKVVLLAKDCIAENVAFSSENYWGSGTGYNIVEPEPSLDSVTGKLTLPESHIAAKLAFDYGVELGGTGRLLTYNEANNLVNMNSYIENIVYGKYEESDGLRYWLASPYSNDSVYILNGKGYDMSGYWGSNGYFKNAKYSTVLSLSDFGVRPVIEISKDSVEMVKDYVMYAEYNIGDEITIEGENFYVIEESDSSKDTLTLLAKYNLNIAGTAQINASSTETACAFSNTNYWSSETTYPVNLNEYTIPEGVTSIIATAKAYGEAKGGQGRLLTEDECKNLENTQPSIVYGTNIGAIDGSLNYWLATGNNLYVSNVYGSFGGRGQNNPTTNNVYGIRPVIEITKTPI